jgi:hypothetical protein
VALEEVSSSKVHDCEDSMVRVVCRMKTADEIIRAIEGLPKPELFKVVRWVEDKRDEIEDAADAAFVASLNRDDEPTVPWAVVSAQMGFKS